MADYVAVVDELYGYFLDSVVGFAANLRTIEQGQRALATTIHAVDFDASAFFYGTGNPTDPATKMQHRTTQGEFKKRNRKGGHNDIRAAQLLIVLIFEYWESEHRQRIADALGCDRLDLKVPILGDLRLLRQDVIHHRGIVREDTVRKLEVLEGFIAGDKLALDSNAVEALVFMVKGAMDELLVAAGNPDPMYRKVLRFSSDSGEPR